LTLPELENRRFKFEECSQLFISTHNETLSVAAMRVNNPDRLPVGITSRTNSAKPVGVGLRLSDCFPNVSPTRSGDASFLITLSDDGASFGFSANVSRRMRANHGANPKGSKKDEA
jgi:hypothetical protein